MNGLKKISIVTTIALIIFHNTCFAQAPHQVAGFTLGDNISKYTDRLKMETALPIRHMGWLKEVDMADTGGIKSGQIWYGTCASPGRIVRIILKSADSSKKHFEKLLKEYNERFGEPNEWRGDAFHIVIAWKWSFTDRMGNKIGLLLQHNTKDSEARIGNSIKLTMGNLMDEESSCYDKMHQEDGKKSATQEGKPTGTMNWEYLIPR